MAARILRICAVLGVYFTLASQVVAAPSISNITTNTGTYSNNAVPRYDKFEVSFQVSGIAATNYLFPYLSTANMGTYLAKVAELGISVDAYFLPPGKTDWQQAYAQPGYYHQEFLDEVRNYKSWYYPTANYVWKVRFAPNQVGTWRYKLVAEDKGGRSESPEATFTVSQSDKKGFIRVASKDARYFEFDNDQLSNPHFTGLGYNSYAINQLDMVDSKEDVLQKMSENGINFVRTWLQPSNIFSSAWATWQMMPPVMDYYLPRTPTVAFTDQATQNVDFKWYVSYGSSWYAPCAFIGNGRPAPAVKPNTNYLIRVTYKGGSIAGPRDPQYPNYGFVIQMSSAWLGDACTNGHWPDATTVPITRVTPYGQNNDGFSQLTGVWNSGSNSFLPYTYMALENVNTGSKAFIDSMEIIEMTGGTAEAPQLTGPNILEKYSPMEHLYIGQRTSHQLDKLMDKLKEHDVYIRMVVSEKDEYLFKKFDDYGNVQANEDNARFYGNFRRDTVPRWLQQAWWRYLQARWGYSANIHSWELLNEGDPNNGNHYAMADEFGKFMHCEVFGVTVPDINGDGYGDGDRCLDVYNHPNDHLTSTSTWHSFPVTSFWGNAAYPNVDFADFHSYSEEIPDAADNTLGFSLSRGALTPGGPKKPVIRGETSFGIIDTPANSGIVADANQDGQPDSQGVWLHNLLWAQLNAGGMYDPSEWMADKFIYEYTCITDSANRCTRDPITRQTQYQLKFDYRYMYRHFHQFLTTLPLTNGNYQDAQPTTTNTVFRIVGQKDVVNKAAHLWIQNRNHTWRNVVDRASIAPASGTVQITGFDPGSQYQVEWWDTYTGQVNQTTTITSDSQGALVLPIQNLTTDVAVKVLSNRPSASPSPTPTLKPGDADGNNVVDGIDYMIWRNHYNQTVSGSLNGDFDNSGRVDGIDYMIWRNNYGK